MTAPSERSSAVSPVGHAGGSGVAPTWVARRSSAAKAAGRAKRMRPRGSAPGNSVAGRHKGWTEGQAGKRGQEQEQRGRGKRGRGEMGKGDSPYMRRRSMNSAPPTAPATPRPITAGAPKNGTSVVSV